MFFPIPDPGLSATKSLTPQLSKPNEVENAVEVALRKGYRHIDAAACYQNENEVGNGWKKSGVPREEIFVCWYLNHTTTQKLSIVNRYYGRI